MIKRTYKPSLIKRKRKFGFFSKSSNKINKKFNRRKF